MLCVSSLNYLHCARPCVLCNPKQVPPFQYSPRLPITPLMFPPPQEMRQALHIVEDGGHEAATSYLGRKIYELQQRCLHTPGGNQQGSASGASGSRAGAPTVAMAGVSNRRGSSEEDLSEDAEDEEQFAASTITSLTYPSTPGSASTAAAGGTGWGTSAPLVQFATPSRTPKPRGPAAGGLLPALATPAAAAVVEVPWALSSWQLVRGLLERTQLGQPTAVLRSLDPIQQGEGFGAVAAMCPPGFWCHMTCYLIWRMFAMFWLLPPPCMMHICDHE
jgi:hypothetical protein